MKFYFYLSVHYANAKNNQAWYVEDIVNHFFDQERRKWIYTVKWKSYADAEAFEEYVEMYFNDKKFKFYLFKYR
jgi:hypothetical protein